MSGLNASSLLPMIMQQALQRAHPQPLPTNMTVTVVAGPYGGAGAGAAAAATLRPLSGMVWGGAGVAPGWVWGGGAWQ